MRRRFARSEQIIRARAFANSEQLSIEIFSGWLSKSWGSCAGDALTREEKLRAFFLERAARRCVEASPEGGHKTPGCRQPGAFERLGPDRKLRPFGSLHFWSYTPFRPGSHALRCRDLTGLTNVRPYALSVPI